MRTQLNTFHESANLSNIFEILASDGVSILVDANRVQSVMFANTNALNFIDESQIIGRSLFLLTGPIGRFFRENRQKFRELRSQNQSSKWLIMAKNLKTAKYCILELTDSPIYKNNRYTGSYIRMVEQKISSNKNIMLALSGINVADEEPTIINPNKLNQPLSPLEYEIVFLLMLGKAPKEIATIQTTIFNREICCSTVSSIINKRIYPKLGVSSISQLFKQAMLNDIVNSLPENFITKIGYKGFLLEVIERPTSIQ